MGGDGKRQQKMEIESSQDSENLIKMFCESYFVIFYNFSPELH